MRRISKPDLLHTKSVLAAALLRQPLFCNKKYFREERETVEIYHFGLHFISVFHKINVQDLAFFIKVDNPYCRSVYKIVFKALGRVNTPVMCDTALNKSMIRTVEPIANVLGS